MRRLTVDQLLEMIAASSRQAVVDAVVELAAVEGLDAVVELLGAVQREVGTRWQSQIWSIADEHAATATVDFALAAAALHVATPTPTLGTIVVACAEEDWHALPARMFAEQLRTRHWVVSFLGGSTPAEHLGAYLARHRPVALAVSCSIPIYLPGARRSIAASHAAGIPAIAGGAAFGENVRRAQAIGADAWARSVDDAHTTVSAWVEVAPALSEAIDDSDQRILSADRPSHVEAAMSLLEAHFPPFSTYSSWQRAKTREDFNYILRFVEAALLTRDDNIVVDFAAWLTQLLRVRKLPDGVVPLSVRCLRANIPLTQTAAHRLLDLIASTSEATQA